MYTNNKLNYLIIIYLLILKNWSHSNNDKNFACMFSRLKYKSMGGILNTNLSCIHTERCILYRKYISHEVSSSNACHV